MAVEYWGLLAVALGLAELFTGGFWMLMMSGAALIGAVTSWIGASTSAQLLSAGAFAVAGTLALKRLRPRRRGLTQQDRSVHLDIGERIDVPAWSADRIALVKYRGSVWRAELRPGHHAQPGMHRIVAMEGNRLVLEPDLNGSTPH